MEDRRLIDLYYLYGKINYGIAYYNLKNKEQTITYDSIKQEIESKLNSSIRKDSLQLVKKR